MRSLKASEGMEVSLLEFKRHERLNGKVCGCEMMIECEVKDGQTVESIENTRREGGDGIGGE